MYAIRSYYGFPTSKPWGNLVGDTYFDQVVSYEGSVGPLETKQQSYQFNIDWLSTSFKIGKLENIFNAGLKYERVEGSTFRSVS